jgi:hypothetical protein
MIPVTKYEKDMIVGSSEKAALGLASFATSPAKLWISDLAA